MAVGAKVGSTPCEDDSAHGFSTYEAWLPGPHIDAVFELKEACCAVGVEVIGDRGAAAGDGLAQDFAQGGSQPEEPLGAELSGGSRGPDFSAEEAFVGVDVADSVKEALVEQGGLDGELASAEERQEVLLGNGKGLASGAVKALFAGLQAVQGEAAEAARVDEAELGSSTERKRGVGVRWNGDLGWGDEQASGHAEMDDPLGFGLVRGLAAAEIEDDVLALAVDAVDAEAGEGVGHLGAWGFEGLLVTAEPDGEDALAAHAGVDSVGDGFDFGEFRHSDY